MTVGAGEGNRTPVVSLGSFCSTIELHPHVRSATGAYIMGVPPIGNGDLQEGINRHYARVWICDRMKGCTYSGSALKS